MVDPTQPAGAVTAVATNLGNNPNGIAFDGANIWTANFSHSISIVTPTATTPWNVTTIQTGISPISLAYDGANMWATDYGAGNLLKLDSEGNVLQTVQIGVEPQSLIFDGTNLWVAVHGENSLKVVRPSSGLVLSVLTGNGLNGPAGIAFDGERILATNFFGHSVSVWRAADFAPMGAFSVGPLSFPTGACSDGVNFWIGSDRGKLLRF
jgi:hypothetical protein